MTTAALLLAAGQSRRFGTQDKLLALLDGIPVAARAMDALAAKMFASRLAVVSSGAVAQLARDRGFEVLKVAPGLPQSHSLVVRVEQLRGNAAISRVLVALADMPLLHPDDIQALLHQAGDEASCAVLNGSPLPPAVFPRSMFGRLAQVSGDRGAGGILCDLPTSCHLVIRAERLQDIDTKQDLISATRLRTPSSKVNSPGDHPST